MAVRSIQELVDRQGRRWELERLRTTSGPAPCVALSRLPRSGATELGHIVADKLEFGFFGIEIVEHMARELGMQRQMLALLDEHVRNVIDRYVADSFRRKALTESTYLRQLLRTLTTLGEGGGAVILGRGSPYVLRPERTLRVLVVAPRSYRLARLAAETQLGEKEAEEQLEQEDAERREFIGHQFGVNPDDPTLYDLVVNTEALGLDGASTLIVDALRSKTAWRYS